MPGDVVIKLVLIGIFGSIAVLLKIFGISSKSGKKNVNLKDAYQIVEAYNLSSKISYKGFEEMVEQKSENPDRYDIKYIIHEILYKNGFGFRIDWKWSPEDILYNIKNTRDPNLSYSLSTKLKDRNTKEELRHKDTKDYIIEDAEWDIKGEVGDTKINVIVRSNKPREFIDYLNPLFEKRWKGRFVEHISDGDEYAFIIVLSEKFKQLNSNKYLI